MRLVLMAAFVLSGCASMQVPRDELFEGYLRESARGTFFVPCLQQEQVWQPNFNGAAKEDLDRLQRSGITRTPKGAFVKIYGTTSRYEGASGYEVISRMLQVTKMVHEAGRECPMGVK